MTFNTLSCLSGAAAMAAFLTVAAVETRAQQAPSGIDCETADTDTDLLLCSKGDLAAAEKQLDADLKRVLAQLPKDGRKLLGTVHRNWLAYRDAECAWSAYDIDTSQMSELIRMTCMAELTAARVEEMDSGVIMQ